MGETIRQSQDTIDVTAALSQELEREDDALLLAVSGDVQTARRALDAHREAFDRSYQRLSEMLRTPAEIDVARALRQHADEYRSVGDRLFDEPAGDKLGSYHAVVNPVLRRAVSDYAELRELTFRSMEAVGIKAGEEARRALGVVTVVSVVALVVSTLTALQLARTVVGPISTLTESVDALRRGEFGKRVTIGGADELGRLSDGFNKMAEALDDFRRSNLGETLRAKTTLESTLAALPDAVIVIDPSGRIAALNTSARSVLEASGTSTAGRLQDLPLPPENVALVRDALAGDKRQPVRRADYSRALPITLDGATHRLLPAVVPIAQFSEERSGAVLVLTDVTDFARLDELRAELIALVSHELRTPLTSLRMNLLMLREASEALEGRQRDILDGALAACEDLSRTIDELLDLSRVEAGQLRLSRDRLDLNVLLAQVVATYRPRFAASGIELVVATERGRAMVMADGPRLSLVVSNLLGNALNYTPPGGRVEVRLSPRPEGDSGRLKVAVSDTGPGVPEEFRDRIFDKFFRVEQKRARSSVTGHGAGFGLYLCRQIVEAHGGRIWCEARPGEPGTTLAFELPGDARRAQPATRPRA